jgi:hypothetical protein
MLPWKQNPLSCRPLSLLNPEQQRNSNYQQSQYRRANSAHTGSIPKNVIYAYLFLEMVSEIH